jgi:hypothetical protein
MTKSSTRQRAVAYAARNHCLSVYGNAIVSFSLQPPDPAFLEVWTRAVDRLAKSSTVKISVVTVVDSNARPPDDASRRAIRDAVSRHHHDIGAFAYVVEGHGFGAAALRSVVSLISLAARYPFPQKVFANVADAAAWMLQRTPAGSEDVTAGGLVSVVEMMRNQVKQLATAV